MTSPPCGGHTGLSAELRTAAMTVLDRLEPALEWLRSEPAGARPPAAGATGPCTVCPVCAVIALVRGERPEMAVRLAAQAVDLIAVLRAVLAEQAPVEDAGPWAGPQPPPRPVQHIPVTRP